MVTAALSLLVSWPFQDNAMVAMVVCVGAIAVGFFSIMSDTVLLAAIAILVAVVAGLLALYLTPL